MNRSGVRMLPGEITQMRTFENQENLGPCHSFEPAEGCCQPGQAILSVNVPVSPSSKRASYSGISHTFKTQIEYHISQLKLISLSTLSN